MTINYIAGLATILWAAHPIQTQAVTYIIQRMASLSAMFYILGIWLYLRMRISQMEGKKSAYRYGAISGLSFLCAILSKENAVLFPLGILCIEIYFFDGYCRMKSNPKKTLIIALVLILIPAAIFFQTTSIEKVLQAYDHRPFNITQRLLTEPRILFFYLSQIFYPIPGRFSIIHSIELSNTIFSPVTTILSIGGIGLMLLFSLTTAKKFPLIGFPIVFFFTHHIVESTIIPLELIFEHRNYLPSLFLFLPVAVLLINTIDYYKTRRKLLYYAISLFCVCLIFLVGFSTYIRNADWQSHESLWKKALIRSPKAIRPYAQLGWGYKIPNRPNNDLARLYFMAGLNKKKNIMFLKKRCYGMKSVCLIEKRNNILNIKRHC